LSFSFYVGSDVARSGNAITSTAGSLDLSAVVTNSATNSAGFLVITTQATSAIVQIDQALTKLAERRATAGAMVNRLEHTVSNLMNVSQRLQEAASGIEDADYAAESAALARGMVLAQAGTAMLAQANQAPQFVLTLLRS
jgi:flagellin